MADETTPLDTAPAPVVPMETPTLLDEIVASVDGIVDSIVTALSPPPALPTDTVTLDFGACGKLTGVTRLSGTHFGAHGAEVSVLIPDGISLLQMVVPERLIVK